MQYKSENLRFIYLPALLIMICSVSGNMQVLKWLKRTPNWTFLKKLKMARRGRFSQPELSDDDGPSSDLGYHNPSSSKSKIWKEISTQTPFTSEGFLYDQKIWIVIVFFLLCQMYAQYISLYNLNFINHMIRGLMCFSMLS